MTYPVFFMRRTTESKDQNASLKLICAATYPSLFHESYDNRHTTYRSIKLHSILILYCTFNGLHCKMHFLRNSKMHGILLFHASTLA